MSRLKQHRLPTLSTTQKAYRAVLNVNSFAKLMAFAVPLIFDFLRKQQN